jgi:hypothetical protein
VAADAGRGREIRPEDRWDGRALSAAADHRFGKGPADDFNLLVKGGVPVANLIGEMGDEVNTFVRQAIAMGTEVPAAMRPMLQQFEDAGLLTDESGQKLKDLSTIKFAQPLETAIQGLIDKMGELIDKIGDVGSAFGGLPDGSLAPSKFSDLMPDANFMAGADPAASMDRRCLLPARRALRTIRSAAPIDDSARARRVAGVLTELRNLNRRLERVQRDQPQ